MYRFLTVLCLCAVPVLTALADERQVLHIQPPRDELDGSHAYYRDLLTALVGNDFDVRMTDYTITQDRAFRFLDEGSLDVVWAGTNVQREQQFRPVRVPLFGGLLGERIPVIRKADQKTFDGISSPDQLQPLVACQGNQWPDSDILEDNGYTVERISQFELMYRMVEGGRCDYFPRAVSEVYGELTRYSNGELMAYDNIVLSYRFPMYFFVSRDHEALAQMLESRLQEWARSGRLLAFIQQHPASRGTFPLERFSSSRIFELTNRRLPPETPLSDDSLWIHFPASEIRSEGE